MCLRFCLILVGHARPPTTKWAVRDTRPAANFPVTAARRCEEPSSVPFIQSFSMESSALSTESGDRHSSLIPTDPEDALLDLLRVSSRACARSA